MAEVRTSQAIGEVFFEPDGGPVVSQVIGEVFYSAGEPEEETLEAVSLDTSKIVGDYYIWLTDEAGTNVALFDDWRSLTINKNLNNPDSIKLVLDGDDDRIDLFELDGQIRIFRKAPGLSIDDYIETEGFVRGTMKQVFKNGNEQFTVYVRGWEDLLARRIIGYKSGTGDSDPAVSGTFGAQKYYVAETVMKEYVRQNAGSEAITANGRLRSGVITELSIATDSGGGPKWSGSRAYKNLLETLIEIGNTTGLDFRVERTDDKKWEFQAGTIGTDRSTVDMDPTTGLNGAGNSPIVFSQNMGTVEEMSYSLRRIDEANICFALGQGEESLRTVVIRENVTASDDSTLNEREISRNGSSQEYTFELRNFADKWLDELGPSEEFKFTPRQTKSAFYGEHYQLGDIVTAQFGDIKRHERIVGVDITVTQNKPEDITLTFREVIL